MPENQGQGQPMMQTLSRAPGKAKLRDAIIRLENRANSLRVLHDMLPEVPTPEQDEAIYLLASVNLGITQNF